MTDTDDLLDTVAVHINWLRRDDPLTNRADSLQSADYLERLAAQLAAARTAIVWMADQGWPDEDMEVMGGPEDGPGIINPRDELFSEMAEDDDLPHRDDVDTWPDHTPALAAVVAALAGTTTNPTPDGDGRP